MKLRKAILFLVLWPLAWGAFSQPTDSTKPIIHFSGAASVTNNGFSFIPSFSLGDPAAIVNISVGGERFSFEPEFRYALEGKPWSFIFIWRYKLVRTDKFQLTVGTHLPALNFRTVIVENNGVTEETIQSQRFFPVLEAAPTYTISKDLSVGLFYLYGRGAKEATTRLTHFLALRVNFSNIPLSKQFYLKFYPQFFYLRGDNKDGIYAASSLTLAKRNFPLSISTLMNKPIQTDIAGGKDFDWNVSLVYSFSGNFSRL